uniref:Uncharacterized protein n=1 Tax=Oryza glumipatula TaxID=40148 RepID=A0A0E0AFX5_9ORYZ
MGRITCKGPGREARRRCVRACDRPENPKHSRRRGLSLPPPIADDGARRRRHRRGDRSASGSGDSGRHSVLFRRRRCRRRRIHPGTVILRPHPDALFPDPSYQVRRHLHPTMGFLRTRPAPLFLHKSYQGQTKIKIGGWEEAYRKLNLRIDHLNAVMRDGQGMQVHREVLKVVSGGVCIIFIVVTILHLKETFARRRAGLPSVISDGHKC